MRCFLFMISFTVTDRSTICILEENIIPAVGEFINIDPGDRWMVEDLISKYARKETITKDDVTVGYVLISIPEKTLELSLASDDGKEIRNALKEIAVKHEFKFEV
jgi:hypothetical protein